jgi:hypothetical protein
MVKKLVVFLMIAALFLCVSGVMADDSGGDSGTSDSGSSDSGSSDDSSSSDSGHDDSSHNGSDTSKDISGKDSSSDSRDSSSDHISGSSVNDDSSSKDSSSGSMDSSVSSTGMDDSSSHDSSSPDAAEVEIEHGITTITSQESEHISAMTAGHAGNVDPAMKSRDSAEIAVVSLTSLSTVPAPVSSQLAEHAKTIEDSLSHLSAAENAIQTRNGIVTFIFGGDKAAANDIEMHVNEDLAALEDMDKILADPSTSPSVKAFTLQREAVIRAELGRINAIAVVEKQKKGIFG